MLSATLNTTLQTLRHRWPTFVGSFVALSLGVALIAVMGLALASSQDAPPRGPERFAVAPVVVKGQDTLTVPTSLDDRTQKLAQPRPVPDGVVAKLRRLGTVVQDRSFTVRAERGPADLVGHPWSTAAFAPYELDAGRAPRAADEVVVSGDWARPGTRLRTGDGTVRVVGTVAGLGFESAVFYTDARAAQLSPRSLQLVVDADASAVREAVRGSGDDGDGGQVLTGKGAQVLTGKEAQVLTGKGATALTGKGAAVLTRKGAAVLPGNGAQVLTGDARRYADADPDRDSEALTAMNAMFGTAGGVTGFVSVFVVASTFAFAVAQRRREFGLLRTAGATPGQIRRMVATEALVVGVLASAAGCALGSYGAPKLAAWAVHESLAPRWFTIGDYTWPYHLAFWTGLFVALCGAVAASWRAGRTGPTEALREASVDARAMTWGRWLVGSVLLATAAVTLVLALVTSPGDLLQRKTYISRPMLLITAVALLAPVLVRPLARLLAWLPARLPGAGGMLVRENAAAGVRRTAAVAAPVLVTVALAGSLLGATATLGGAKATEIRERTAADFVVTPAGDAGFDAATLKRLRAVPGGTAAAASSSSAVYVLEDGVALIKSDARAVEPGPFAATARLPLTAGKVRDLDDDSIIVNEEWARHTVGERVDVWLGDGTRKSLEVAAVMTTGTGNNGVYVTPRNAPTAPVDRVDVRLAPGADPATVASGLRAAVRASGGEVLTRDAWVRAMSPETNRTTRTGLFMVLGIALLYTGISVANTMVMATSDRVRELAVLRLAGATGPQVLRLVGAEALMVVMVGGLLGALVAALNLVGMWSALGLLSVWTSIEIPWATLGAVLGACAVLAVISAVAPAGLALRRGGMSVAGVRE
ncbi:FtsX-like permease family protein [Streptomyces sp. Je 1-369]|uniref:FtsX-like permease family protein n=1 Tax=Streptomyces sp. Je 1-369 TaxID=2966192 RepID=UPI0022854B1F|nr:FtsX-like permease family protein [Streptomyces sp. Je 1-369]WAL98683.1 FtsX-like permease family protein [Streptomyces sp. Je 1-369]